MIKNYGSHKLEWIDLEEAGIGQPIGRVKGHRAEVGQSVQFGAQWKTQLEHGPVRRLPVIGHLHLQHQRLLRANHQSVL